MDENEYDMEFDSGWSTVELTKVNEDGYDYRELGPVSRASARKIGLEFVELEA